MDGPSSQPRQSSRPPYGRSPSRASTVGSNTRSVSSSNSHVPASPAHSYAHPAHRFHHNACAASPKSSTRPTPQLSREASSELARQPAISTFLQERLQKERKTESDKLSSSTSSRHNFDMSASVDLGRVGDKPSKSADADGQRPQSSAGAEAGKKKGLGVKEMEQVVSTLHKQNFDLKLELFHRRERQTKLEQRLELLEAEKQEAQQQSDGLMSELEKRDKAIEEAVGMIVALEAKIDQLLDERNIVKQMESQGLLYPGDLGTYANSCTDETAVDTASVVDRAKTPTVNRMPSFLSDRSTTTENLRNVYLGNRGSILSLRRVSEGPSEADNGATNGLASPTLSVLSESSFLSVYGQKGGDTTVIPDFDEPLTLNGIGDSPPRPQEERSTHDAPNGRAGWRNEHPASPEKSRGQSSAYIPPISNVLNSDSPLQRMERMETVGSDRIPAPSQRHAPDAVSRSRHVEGNQATARRATKDEKRAALRKVMTETQGGARLHDQGLPPTPDTISSSTLQRYKTSNDNISVRQKTSNEMPWGPSLDGASRDQRVPAQYSGGVSLVERQQPQSALGKPDTTRPSYDVYGAKNIPRPHSAGDTTISHKRQNSWDSDDSDSKSLKSSLDIWLRESTKPTRTTGRASPDLFGFATNMANGGWAMDSLFDPKNSRLGSMPSTDYMHDLLSLREALLSPNLPPPPPDRRSSLHAQTRSVSAAPSSVKPLAMDGTWQPPPQPPQPGPNYGASHEASHGRRNSDLAGLRANASTPVQNQAPPQPSSESKKSHYPPTSWQQGPRGGLNKLFRRSLGGAPVSGKTDGVPVQDGGYPEMTKTASHGEAPSWVSRSGVIDDDRSGATPPPIMFNPRQQRRRNSASSGPQPGVSESKGYEYMPTSTSSMDAANAQATGGGAQLPPSSTGSRRKWLQGFSRTKN
ncbi:hypothetical protein K4F52_010065 [Lecanicillium sp. MT-2017a]|nr:hypothetical protein K4F52_010065 [Lecanicillium sp. MT-2017a]